MSEKFILLVEDNPSDVELTRRALQKANIANPLFVAETGEEALNYLFGRGEHTGRDSRQMPSLVLLDLKLPGMGGIDVIRLLRENPITHRQPVVVLSSSREESDIAQSYDMGANSYIRKPVDFLQFVQMMQQVSAYWINWNEQAPAEA